MTGVVVALAVLALSSAGQLQARTEQVPVEPGGLPMRDLLRIADTVVVGRLGSVSEWSEDEREHGRGVIEVTDVIWGAAARGDTLVLEWSQYEAPRPHRELSELLELDWIWLLSATAPGRVRAVSTRCTYRSNPESREWMEQKLASAPVLVRSDPCRFAEGEELSVEFGYRNYGSEVREFPGLVCVDSVLYVDPQVSVRFALHPAFRVDPRPGRLVESDSLPPVRVDPMSETTITFDPSVIFPVRRGDYRIVLDVEGYGAPMSRILNVR
jgi:hypothetical protein